MVAALPEIGERTRTNVQVLRDAGHIIRARIEPSGGTPIEVDIVHDPVQDLEGASSLEGIVLKSLKDLRASKLTCILSRSEPRDLVDLLYLENAGYPPDQDLDLALQKDAGIDPGVLAWLLAQFPIAPLPQMLTSLSTEQLKEFRDTLAQRLRQLAL